MRTKRNGFIELEGEIPALHLLREELIAKIADRLKPAQIEILRATQIRWSYRLRTSLGRAYYAVKTKKDSGAAPVVYRRFFDRLMAETFGRIEEQDENPAISTETSNRHNCIELNARLLAQHPEEIKPTFVHEFAHIVAPLIYGRRGLNHQEGWQEVMRAFGYPPERTHNLDVSALQRKHATVAIAVCGCKGFEHEIKARRYEKMRRGKAKYKCLKCHEQLRLVIEVK